MEIITFKADDPHLDLFNELGKHALPKDAICYLALRHAKPLARLTTQIVTGMHKTSTECGVIGFYEAIEPEAGIALLKRALTDLSMSGIMTVIGPMNGTTWDRYRFALPKDSQDLLFDPPTFLGEPRNPEHYPQEFLSAGFKIVERYESRIVHQLTIREKQAQQLLRKMNRLGITIAPIDLKRYEQELREIFDLSTQNFAHNHFYHSIDFDRFKGLYAGIKPYLDPEFILLARDKNSRLVGFVFAYPDLESIQAQKPPRLVFKTLVVTSEVRASGIAIYLMDAIHLKAHTKGFQSVIHALMHSDNNSLKLSNKSYQSELFKQYALFQVLY